MNGISVYEAILKTSEQTLEKIRTEFTDVSEAEIQVYFSIYQYMDGKTAVVAPYDTDGYVYIGLTDEAQDKELSWLMEQDPFMGTYIDQREEFERAYDAGDYVRDGMFCLNNSLVEIKRAIAG